MLYKTVLVLISLWIANLLHAQCNIYCKDVDAKNKTTMVGFKLFLAPQNGLQPILISNTNGTLFINRTDYNKLKYRQVVGFDFLNPIDHERYSMPHELKQRSFTLGELCGKTLVVGFLW